MQQWLTRARDVILDCGKFLKVENHVVELPNGEVIDDWAWVVTPDYVNVVVVDDLGRFLLFRQTKYAVDGLTIATVGGYLEPGEDPLPAAQRELLEETGYSAETWVDLGRYVCDGNRGCGTANLFLALDATRVTAPNADDLEEQELLLLTRDEVEAMLDRGDMKVMGWVSAVVLALRHLDRQTPPQQD